MKIIGNSCRNNLYKSQKSMQEGELAQSQEKAQVNREYFSSLKQHDSPKFKRSNSAAEMQE